MLAPFAVLSILGCQDPPPLTTPIAATRPRLIAAEPVAQVEAEQFDGCGYDPTPMLAIFPKLVLLDGTSVDEEGLAAVLQSKQELYQMLGSMPKNDLVVQVAAGVPEKRVQRLLARAWSAGFVNVIRMSIAAPAAPTPSGRRRHQAAKP